MPNFYDDLTNHFHEMVDARAMIETALVSVDRCMNILTGLMEQAAHLRTDLEDVQRPPLAPPHVWAGIGENVVPAIPAVASSLELVAPEPSFAGVNYDTPTSSTAIGTITYE